MPDWKSYKGNSSLIPPVIPGQFSIVPVDWDGNSGQKPSYNEGDSISDFTNPVWSMEQGSDVPITPNHNPCGYWFGYNESIIISGYSATSSYEAKNNFDSGIYTEVIMSVDGTLRLVSSRKIVPDGYYYIEGRFYGSLDGKIGDLDCIGDGMLWDSITSAETVARNSQCIVAILDTTGLGRPYYWWVSGTGFTIDAAITDGLTNIVRADATACGTATVTVIGCDGTVVTGYVRCTTGTWVKQSCEYDWPFAPAASGTIIGKYKIEGSNHVCYNNYFDTYTEAPCQAALAAEIANLSHQCCQNIGLPTCTKTCTERIPQACSAGYTKGVVWNFCYKPCYWTGYRWRYFVMYYDNLLAFVYLWEC